MNTPTPSVQAVEQLLEACSLRLIEVQAEMQKFWDWIHSPMGIGPERRRIYEDQIRALSEESDRLALSREGLLAELRRITPADR